MILNIFIIFTYVLLIGSLVVGNWYGVEELLNISIACTWVFSSLIFLALLLPSDKFFSQNDIKRAIWPKAFLIIHLFTLVAAGWMFTAAVLLIFWGLMYIKRILWIEKLNN